MLFSKEKKQNQKQKNAKTIVYNVTNSRNIVKKKLSNNTPEMKKLLDSSHTKLGHKQSPVIVFFFFVYWYWLHSQRTLNCLEKMQMVASY